MMKAVEEVTDLRKIAGKVGIKTPDLDLGKKLAKKIADLKEKIAKKIDDWITPKAKKLRGDVPDAQKKKLHSDAEKELADKDPDLDKKKDSERYQEKLMALATAKAIATSTDVVNTPIATLMGELAFLEKLKAVTDITKTKVVGDVYDIFLIGSPKKKVKRVDLNTTFPKGKVGKVEYEIQKLPDGRERRLLANAKDLDYVKNYNISRYKAKLREPTKTYKLSGSDEKVVAKYYVGKDKMGNEVEIEYAPKGHPSTLGGNEPPHVKVNIRGAHFSKYFLKSDLHRLK